MSENIQAIHENIIHDGKENRINEVVVFSDQAFIKRQLEISLHEGKNRILIEIGAYYVDQDSIQAQVFGEGEILSVQYRKIPVAESVKTDVRVLEEQKRKLDLQKKVLQRAMDSIDKQRRFLESTISYAEVQIPREIKTVFPEPDKLKNMLSFFEQNFNELNEKETTIEKQLEELERELNVVQVKLKQLKKPTQSARQFIEVLFVSQITQEVKFDVCYVASQAWWKPVYKVNASADLDSVTLTTFAQIEQNTGEDWSNVVLSVSNAVPLKGGRLPVQKSWSLHLSSTQTHRDDDFIVDALPVSAMAEPETCEIASGDELGELVDLDSPFEESASASYAQSTEKELPLAFEFELPQTVTIENNGGENLLPIICDSVEGKFFHLCMPKQDLLVYLVCEAIFEKTLLPGKLNIYFAGRFVSSTYLEEKQAGEELMINLGAERDIKVKREKITDKLTDSFFGVVDRLSAAREFVYQIDIENLKEKPVNLRLVDALPVSSSDRIQVKETKCEPVPDIKDWQDREGVMLWKLVIPEKASKKVKLSFFVKFPKDDPPYEI